MRNLTQVRATWSGRLRPSIDHPSGLTGLYQIALSAGASNGSVDSGNFMLSAQWYDGNPSTGGAFIAEAIETSAAYTATVAATSAVPEPSSSVMLAAAIALTVGLRAVRQSYTRAGERQMQL
jgi:hypothetical protein